MASPLMPSVPSVPSVQEIQKAGFSHLFLATDWHGYEEYGKGKVLVIDDFGLVYEWLDEECQVYFAAFSFYFGMEFLRDYNPFR
jgi:hypothetical protein